MTCCTSGKLVTSSPSTATMRSPGKSLPSAGLAGTTDAHRRGQELLVLEEDGRVERDGKEQVHRRPREDDDDALPERLRLERAVPVLGQDRLAALALLEHLHEAAERQEADAVLGLLAADADDLRAESDREREHLHAEDLGEGKVPRLVDEDEGADEEDEVQKVHGSPTRYRE